MDKDELYNILSRYLMGTADEEDIMQLQHWLKKSEANKTFFYNITEYWDTERKYFLKDSTRLAENIIQRISKLEQRKGQKLSGAPSYGPKRMAYAKIAAFITLLFIVGGILFFVIRADLPGPEPQRSLVYIEKSTKRGEKLSIRLPDGTRVKLNYNSRLRYPENFSDSQRAVTLVGEAYFDVVKNSTMPFIVKSGDLATTVLGTSFNIRAFPDENDISVAVVSGRVMVRKIDNVRPDSLTLIKEQMAVYSKRDKQTIKSNFEYQEVIGWKDGIITFENANIYEIFQTLEQWYGMTIQVRGTLNKNRGFTVTYENKSLTTILDGLSFTFDFSYSIDGDTVKINELN